MDIENEFDFIKNPGEFGENLSKVMTTMQSANGQQIPYILDGENTWNKTGYSVQILHPGSVFNLGIWENNSSEGATKITTIASVQHEKDKTTILAEDIDGTVQIKELSDNNLGKIYHKGRIAYFIIRSDPDHLLGFKNEVGEEVLKDQTIERNEKQTEGIAFDDKKHTWFIDFDEETVEWLKFDPEIFSHYVDLTTRPATSIEVVDMSPFPFRLGVTGTDLSPWYDTKYHVQTFPPEIPFSVGYKLLQPGGVLEVILPIIEMEHKSERTSIYLRYSTDSQKLYELADGESLVVKYEKKYFVIARGNREQRILRRRTEIENLEITT